MMTQLWIQPNFQLFLDLHFQHESPPEQMAGCYKNTSVGATFTITDIIWTLLNRCPANVRASPVRKDTPRLCPWKPNATKVAGGGEHRVQHIGRGSLKTALCDCDIVQRVPCACGFINPSEKTLHVFPSLQWKTEEVTFRTDVFCSSKMVRHNRAADGRYHCARSLVFCRCFWCLCLV